MGEQSSPPPKRCGHKLRGVPIQLRGSHFRLLQVNSAGLALPSCWEGNPAQPWDAPAPLDLRVILFQLPSWFTLLGILAKTPKGSGDLAEGKTTW